MDDATRDELAELRRRAYGPGSGIADDPLAQERLSELESRARDEAERSDLPPAADDIQDAEVRRLFADPSGAPAATASTAAGEDEPPSTGADSASGGPAPIPHPRRIAVHWLVAWAASMLVVAVVVGTLVFGLASVPPVATAAGRQIATLTERVDAPAEMKGWASGAPATGFAFEGLIVVPTPMGVGVFGSESECIMVAPSDGFGSDGSIRGEVFWSCRAGEFPATVQFVVSSSSTEALRARFPLGTALRFVLDGDRVGVFTDVAPDPSSAPA